MLNLWNCVVIIKRLVYRLFEFNFILKLFFSLSNKGPFASSAYIHAIYSNNCMHAHALILDALIP